MSKRISIANHKGGVAKTTTTVSLGHGLSLTGKRVLIVDVDPQGNSTSNLGVKHKQTLYHLLTGKATVEECIVQARDNLDLIGSNKTLSVAEQQMMGEMGRERFLKRSLGHLNGKYDYILFDCAPSWRLLNQNAFLASEKVIIPINMEYFALMGVKEIMSDLKNIRELLDHPVDVALVVPTFFDVRNSKSARILDQLIEFFGKEKVAKPIRTSVRISEAPYYKKTIFEYDPKGRGTEDYVELTKRVLAL